MDAPCSDRHIATISRKITTWEILTPFFDVTAEQEEEIRRDYPNQYLVQKYKMLLKWKQSLGNKATYSKLKECFSSAGEQLLADQVNELVYNPTSPNSGEGSEKVEEEDRENGLPEKKFKAETDQESMHTRENGEPCPTAVNRRVPAPCAATHSLRPSPQYSSTSSSSVVLGEHASSSPQDASADLSRTPSPTLSTEEHSSAVVTDESSSPFVEESSFEQSRILEEYSASLKKYYLRTIELPMILNDPHPSFIEPILVEMSSEENSNVARLMSVSDIGASSEPSPQVIIVEGDVGTGKTVLCNELLLCWAKEELLQQYKVVFMSKQSCQPWLGIYELPKPDPRIDGEYADTLITAVVCNARNSVLQIFDENEKLETFDGLNVEGMSLLYIVHPLVKSIVSRPYSQQIRLLGFSNSGIDRYVEMSCANGNKFQEWLSSHPLARAMMHIPLYCTIIVYLFTNNRIEEFRCVTDLYKLLVLSMFEDHWEKESGCSDRFHGYSELPKNLNKMLDNFLAAAFKDHHDPETKWEIYSNLPAEHKLLDRGRILSHLQEDGFLHSTLRAYMCALYCERDPYAVPHLPILSPSNWIFVSGMNIQSAVDHYSQFFALRDSRPIPLPRFGSRRGEIVLEQPKSSQFVFELIHKESLSTVSRCLPLLHFSPIVLEGPETPLQWFTVGFCSARLKLSLKIVCNEGKMSLPEHLQAYSAGVERACSFDAKAFADVRTLSISAGSHLMEWINILPSLRPYILNTTEISLDGELTRSCESDGLDVASYCPKLEVVSIFSTSADYWFPFFASIARLSSLKELRIFIRDVLPNVGDEIVRSMPTCESLEVIPLSSKSANFIAKVLKPIPSGLRKLTLSDCCINVASVQSLSKHYSTLNSLELQGCSEDQEAFSILAEGLKQSSVECLTLTNNRIGSRNAKLFADVCKGERMEILSIRCDESIGLEGAQAFGHAIEINWNLRIKLPHRYIHDLRQHDRISFFPPP